MKVLVCGSRDWNDPQTIKNRLLALKQQHGGELHIIHGAARGADVIAAMYARSMDIPEQAYPAKWRQQGRKAGILRNLEMLDQKPDLVLAFWDGVSTGTQHVINEATTRAIPVEIVTARGSEAESGKPR